MYCDASASARSCDVISASGRSTCDSLSTAEAAKRRSSTTRTRSDCNLFIFEWLPIEGLPEEGLRNDDARRRRRHPVGLDEPASLDLAKRRPVAVAGQGPADAFEEVEKGGIGRSRG